MKDLISEVYIYMGQEKKKGPLLGSFVLLVMMVIPMYLISKQLFFGAATYILVFTIWLVFVNRKIIILNITTFFSEWKKIKRLDYYFITDDSKKIDQQKRKESITLVRDIAMMASLALFFNLFSMFHILNKFFGNHIIVKIFLITFLLLVCVLGYGGILVKLIFKHMTMTYVSVPFIAAMIFWGLYFKIDESPVFVRLLVYLVLVVILYQLLSMICPLNILRNLNNTTVLISSFLTILGVFMGQVAHFVFFKYIKEQDIALTVEKVKAGEDIPDILKNTLVSAPELIDLLNYLGGKLILDQLNSYVSLGVTSLTLSFILGGLIITRKVKRNKVWC